MLPRAFTRLLLLIVCLAPLQAHAQVTTELDALWADVARSVAAGDADLYLSTYHPDAIFVSIRRGITRTVAEDVEANRAAWNDTRDGRARRSVEFRFTERLNNATAAHEVGIFRYASTEADGTTRVALIHFEAALVKKDGVWLQLLELQTSDATEAEWEAARQLRDMCLPDKAGGLTIRSRIEELVPPTRIVWTGRTMTIPAVHSWVLEDHGDTTMVRTEESFAGFMASVLPGPLRKMLAQSLASGLDALAKACEARRSQEAIDQSRRCAA